MKTIQIRSSKIYDIVIGNGILGNVGATVRNTLPKAAKIMVVSDDNVFPLYGNAVSESLEAAGFSVFSYVFPHGESHKTLETYGALLNEMCGKHLTRTDAVLALGGGVVGDLAGFAAATYQRGISLVQMPTSLLAAVDSSVGGKTAVDLPAGKNQVGAFYQPDLVVCDTALLATLPPEEYRNGCGEIIKYAVLDGPALFDKLFTTPVSEQYEAIIAHCVEIKRRVVEEDEHDVGARMLLNLGHTIGHGVETCSEYTVAHGQAVAIGLAAIIKAGEAKGITEPGLYGKITGLLSLYGLSSALPYNREELGLAALNDKKNASGIMRVVVPYSLGDCRIIPLSPAEFNDWLALGGAK